MSGSRRNSEVRLRLAPDSSSATTTDTDAILSLEGQLHGDFNSAITQRSQFQLSSTAVQDIEACAQIGEADARAGCFPVDGGIRCVIVNAQTERTVLFDTRDSYFSAGCALCNA